jgi:homopolymeric O-antigen transport system ATP-binding protein
MTAIRIDHVSKAYARHRHLTRGIKESLLHLPDVIRRVRAEPFRALDDICLEVRKGEAVGIIGANGSGKSTMLALIAGVIEPEAGTIEVDGRVAPLLELGAGFHYELTGRENIVLNGVLMGLTRREVAERMEAIVAFSGLEAWLNEPIRTYSSGMVARLGFSVAVHLDPEILLVDEILAVGDAHFQAKCYDRLDEFRRQGVTIVIVTHALAEVQRLCERAVWLDGGKIAMQGEPEAVLEAYAKS